MKRYPGGGTDYAALLAADDLVVTGGGALKIDKDLKTDGFAGEIHVRKGATIILTNAGALGDTTKGTFVEDGATLVVDTAGVMNSISFVDEHLSFAGRGSDGMGALQVLTSGTNQRTGCWGGTVMAMTGDAMISLRGGLGGSYDFPCQSSNNSLDMNGHTLTMISDGTLQYVLPVRFKVTNPGHMMVSNRVYLSVNGIANLGGSAENTLTIGYNSCIDLYGATTEGALKWKLILDSSPLGALRSTNGGGVWDGPIERAKDAMLIPIISGSATDRPVLKFAGGFAVTEGFVEVTNATKNAAYTKPIVELPVANNSFPDGFKLTDVELRLGDATAFGSASGLLTLINAPITFSDSSLAYALPATAVKNDSDQAMTSKAITCAQTFTKDGAGSLDLNATVAFKNLDVKNGLLTLQKVENRHWNAGLYKGTNQNYTGWATASPNARDDGWKTGRICYTNEVVLGPDVAMKATAIDYGKLTVITYKGYIWNRDTSSSSRVITFCCSASAVSKIYVATTGTTEPAIQQGDESKIAGIRMTPGAHPIEIRIATNSGKTGPNGLFSSDYGIMYAWGSSTSSSTDPADYLPFMDPGDGSLLTLTVPDTPEYEALQAEALAARQVAESATVDGSLDLGSGNLSVLSLSGTGSITNKVQSYATDAKLTVAQTLSLRKADLFSGKHLTVDGKLSFGSGACVSLDSTHGLVNGRYAIASSTQPIEGVLSLGELPATGFSLVVSDDRKTLYLDVCRGFYLMVK